MMGMPAAGGSVAMPARSMVLGMEPREAVSWMEAEMVPVFPLGNLRDR